ncbi:MAG: hypothetical protein AVDCRST_MAG31-2591, partial [uncultured Sphingomonas sp.]
EARSLFRPPARLRARGRCGPGDLARGPRRQVGRRAEAQRPQAPGRLGPGGGGEPRRPGRGPLPRSLGQDHRRFRSGRGRRHARPVARRHLAPPQEALRLRRREPRRSPPAKCL